MHTNRFFRPCLIGFATGLLLTLPIAHAAAQCLTSAGKPRYLDCEFVVDNLTITGASPAYSNVPNLSPRVIITLNPNQAKAGAGIPSPKFPLQLFTFTLNLTIRRVAPAAYEAANYAIVTRLYPQGQNLSTLFSDAGMGPGGLLAGPFTIAKPAINLKVGESQTIQIPLELGLTVGGSSFKSPFGVDMIFFSLDMSLYLANPQTVNYLRTGLSAYSDMRDLSEWSCKINFTSFKQ